jgi:hypothetical protein
LFLEFLRVNLSNFGIDLWESLMLMLLNGNFAGIAQLVEQRIENPRVPSSSLGSGIVRERVEKDMTMSYEEMQAVLTQMLAVDRQLQERQLSHESEMIELRALTASNARAIEALGNKTSEMDAKMSNLIQIVGEFV